jgi:predicted nucleic-acid-binding protein
MIGIDTNILVRFFAQDHAAESRRVDTFFQKLTPAEPGFVSLVALIELVWVMRSRYRMSRSELIQSMRRLLTSPEIVVENERAVDQAIDLFGAGKADFPNCLIERSGCLAGCKHTVTFDVNASKTAGMKLL